VRRIPATAFLLCVRRTAPYPLPPFCALIGRVGVAPRRSFENSNVGQKQHKRPYPKIIPKAPAELERTPREFTLEEVLRDDASTTRG
jgi:hypothetical protein